MSGYVELYILLSKTKFLFYLPQAKSEQKTINPNDTKVFIFFSHDNKRSKVALFGHSIKPGLDPGLDSGLWTLDSQLKFKKKKLKKKKI